MWPQISKCRFKSRSFGYPHYLNRPLGRAVCLQHPVVSVVEPVDIKPSKKDFLQEGSRGRGRGNREYEDQIRPPVILTKPHPVVDDNEEEWPTITAAVTGKVMAIKSRTHSPTVEVDKSITLSRDVKDKKAVSDRKDFSGVSAAPKQPGTIQVQRGERSHGTAAPEPQIFTNRRFAAKNERASPDTGEWFFLGAGGGVDEKSDVVQSRRFYAMKGRCLKNPKMDDVGTVMPDV